MALRYSDPTTTLNVTAGYAYIQRFTPNADVTASGLWVYTTGGSSPSFTEARLYRYSDSTLLADFGGSAPHTDGNWSAITFPSPVALSAGVEYAILVKLPGTAYSLGGSPKPWSATSGVVTISSTTGYYTTTGNFVKTNGNATYALSVGLVSNAAPNAPILTAPADASTIDRTATQRFDWDFSDPDAGDTQSAYSLRYRVVGAATWTETGWTSTPNTYHDIAGGTFADATDYEWQVATKDAQGVEGPYSSSWFFTAANAPGGPTITMPVSGGTVEQFQTVEWSTPNQDAYQIQVLDGTTVTYDSGAMVSSTARSAVVEFPDNDVARTLQIRVQDGGLWSPWTAISVSVSYTPPPTPSLVAAASNADGAVSVTVTTPAAGAGEPTVEYVDLYVRDTTGQDKYRPAAGIRLAAQQLPNGVVIDWIAASGDNYEYQAVAVGDNGTTSASAWTAIDPDAVATVYYGGDY